MSRPEDRVEAMVTTCNMGVSINACSEMSCPPPGVDEQNLITLKSITNYAK